MTLPTLLREARSSKASAYLSNGYVLLTSGRKRPSAAISISSCLSSSVGCPWLTDPRIFCSLTSSRLIGKRGSALFGSAPPDAKPKTTWRPRGAKARKASSAYLPPTGSKTAVIWPYTPASLRPVRSPAPSGPYRTTTSAPASRQAWALAAEETQATTLAPSALARSKAAMPVPPAAPRTRRVSPACSCATRTKAWCTSA
mmetsp:Transcript_97662/g.271770  ORF Transcript_97662/g.271770 Transcript_97662/m.271770 type:complete len:200 (+) Transcript_97662:182-781(+)